MKRALKITLIVITILVVIINIPIIGGLFLPKSHTVTKSIHLNYDIENVWIYITNVKQYPQWLHRVKKVEVVSTNPQGLTSWQEYYQYRKPTMFQIIESAPYSDLVIKIADKETPLLGKWTYHLKEEENGTLLTITETTEIYNPIYRSIAYLKGQDSNLNEYIKDLQEGMNHQ